MLKIDTKYEDGVLYVRLDGSLNAKTCHKITNYLLPVLSKHNIKLLVYNFGNLLNIDVKGRDAILNSKYIIKQNKGKMLMCQVSDNIYSFFKGMHIATIARERDARKYVNS